MVNGASLSFRSPAVWWQGSTHSAALQNGCPGGVDVGHQLVGLLIAPVGVVTFGQRKIGSGELSGGDRPDVDPQPSEQRHSLIGKQLSPCPQFEVACHRNLSRVVNINQIDQGHRQCTDQMIARPHSDLQENKNLRKYHFSIFETIVVTDR